MGSVCGEVGICSTHGSCRNDDLPDTWRCTDVWRFTNVRRFGKLEVGQYAASDLLYHQARCLADE